MTLDSNDSDEGERRKAETLAALAKRRSVYVRRGQRALLTALLTAGEASADDVRNAVELPPGIDPVCLGAVPGALARTGIIRRVGYVSTCRSVAHARPVALWTLADRQRALAWLADHPALADLDDGEVPADGSQLLLFPIQPRNDSGAAVAAAAPGQEF